MTSSKNTEDKKIQDKDIHAIKTTDHQNTSPDPPVIHYHHYSPQQLKGKEQGGHQVQV